jgi:hypothetical protein
MQRTATLFGDDCPISASAVTQKLRLLFHHHLVVHWLADVFVLTLPSKVSS